MADLDSALKAAEDNGCIVLRGWRIAPQGPVIPRLVFAPTGIFVVLETGAPSVDFALRANEYVDGVALQLIDQLTQYRAPIRAIVLADIDLPEAVRDVPFVPSYELSRYVLIRHRKLRPEQVEAIAHIAIERLTKPDHVAA